MFHYAIASFNMTLFTEPPCPELPVYTFGNSTGVRSASFSWRRSASGFPALYSSSFSMARILIELRNAGLEASGTGNMKFMMNGAVTIGTMDGANVEIYERVGAENIFIFGAGVEEITQMERYGTYHPSGFYEQNADIRQALNCLIDGTLHVSGDAQFSDLYHSLLFGDSERADKYYVIYDFASYNQVYTKMMETYENREAWRRMAARNLAASGYFCADRAIAEYNDKIWHLMPIE